MREKSKDAAQVFIPALIVMLVGLASTPLLAITPSSESFVQARCDNERRTFLGNIDVLTFEMQTSSNGAAHNATFRLEGESLRLGLVHAEDPLAATMMLEYSAGLRVIATTVRFAEIAGADQESLQSFLDAADGPLMESVRNQALRQMLRRNVDPVMQTFLQLQMALVNTRGTSGGLYVDPMNILDCAPYAACYWGCTLGGGGFYDCGTHCNGGGPGGLCW